MSNNVNYSFITDSSNEASIVFRSTVNSFGLDHVTDKDITSFYRSFSNYLHFDTGLLPVDGSGILSIRSAGPHTQVAYQHKPGFYYINWGDYEGDRSATKYYVAQPYRIVIGDFYNNSIYGARTFYSPVPITHPTNPLYHVNLPNINCRGYRGNAVGWICLYHNEDVSSYPFSERLIKLLDRCSGTEAYNDQNMSETDGPRFYRDHNKPQHLWNPFKWQEYSEQHSYEWTLDPDLWIPVLVRDIDSQDRHSEDGQPLTFVDALLGNAQMYYTDTFIPKPYNQLCRSDMSLPSSSVTTWFKQSYNSSLSLDRSTNYYQNISSVRENISNQVSDQLSFDDEEDEEPQYYCPNCSQYYHTDDSFSTIKISHNVVVSWCENCTNEHASYVEHADEYYSVDYPTLVWSHNLEEYFDTDIWEQHTSCECGTSHIWSYSLNYLHLNLWYSVENLPFIDPRLDTFSPQQVRPLVCSDCITNVNTCHICSAPVFASVIDKEVHQYTRINPFTNEIENYCPSCYYNKNPYHFLNSYNQLSDSSIVTCFCGESHPYHSFKPFPQNYSKFIVNHYFYSFEHYNVSLNQVYNYLLSHNYFSNSWENPNSTNSCFSINFSFCCPTCSDAINNITNSFVLNHVAISKYTNELRQYFTEKINYYVANNKKFDNIYGISFEIY